MASPPSNLGPPGPPTSISDQITWLIARGVSIPDHGEAARFLSNVNFYRFRGYPAPFVNRTATSSQHPFQPGTSFGDVVERYDFDRRLRILLLDAFNQIEVSIRTQWTYHLSYTHGGGESAHLNSSLFHNSYSKNLAKLEWTYKQHGQASHGYAFNSCPIWAIVEVMPLGQLSQWYRDTNRQVRQDVGRHYQLNERMLGALLRQLGPVRNLCAHHERLWDREFSTKLRVPKRLGAFANPTRFFNMVDRGRLYNTLVMIAYLTRVIANNSEWAKSLVTLMNQYERIPQGQMGFVTDWQRLDIWQG